MMNEPQEQIDPQRGVVAWVSPYHRPRNAPYAVYDEWFGTTYAVVLRLICAECTPIDRRTDTSGATRPVQINEPQTCDRCGLDLWVGPPPAHLPRQWWDD